MKERAYPIAGRQDYRLYRFFRQHLTFLNRFLFCIIYWGKDSIMSTKKRRSHNIIDFQKEQNIQKISQILRVFDPIFVYELLHELELERQSLSESAFYPD